MSKEKTISQILEEVANSICDDYCKFPNECKSEEELYEICEDCPQLGCLLNILELGLSEGEIMRIGATLAVHDAMITSAMEGEENAIEFCKSGLKDAEAVGMPWLELGKYEEQTS